MSEDSSSNSSPHLSDLLAASSQWSRDHRIAHLVGAGGGGVLALAIHMFGPSYLPFSLPRWFLYVNVGDYGSIGRGALFWFLTALIVFAFFGCMRGAGFKGLADGLASVPARMGGMLRGARQGLARTLMVGLAAGFLYITIFDGGAAAGGFGTAVPFVALYPPLQVMILVAVLVFALSRLSEMTARTLAHDPGIAAPQRVAAFCVAFALPLLLTLPFGWFTMTTRIALLFGVLGLLVWKTGMPTVHASTIPLLLMTAALMFAVPGTLFAQNFWDTSTAPDLAALMTKDQWLNAVLVAVPGAFGAAAGLSLGHGLAQLGASAGQTDSPAISPAPTSTASAGTADRPDPSSTPGLQ